ncbi:MAG: hypothetical protein J6I76_01005 [Oribacterium sp.]|nr:hypothetical protein [Oribacterium sp.]
MEKRVIAIILTFTIGISTLSGCGSKAGEEVPQAVTNTTVETEKVAESKIEESEQTSGESTENLEALGDIDVDKGLFNVTLTIPKDFIGEATQEDLDDLAKEKGIKSITLNSDGSATYVMSKAKHEEMVSDVRKQINDSLQEMVGSETYPNIIAISADDDFTNFTVTTKNKELDFAESFGVMALYMYGSMYAVFSGEEVDNIHVEFVNADSGEVISSGDSKDMKS